MTDSRSAPAGDYVIRVRECINPSCRLKTTTYEREERLDAEQERVELLVSLQENVSRLLVIARQEHR